MYFYEDLSLSKVTTFSYSEPKSQIPPPDSSLSTKDFCYIKPRYEAIYFKAAVSHQINFLRCTDKPTVNTQSLTQLHLIGGLIQSSIDTSVRLNEASKNDLPAKPLFDAQRALLSAAGKLTGLVSQPSARILEVSSQYFEARRLHTIAEKRVPDILVKAGNDGV